MICRSFCYDKSCCISTKSSPRLRSEEHGIDQSRWVFFPPSKIFLFPPSTFSRNERNNNSYKKREKPQQQVSINVHMQKGRQLQGKFVVVWLSPLELNKSIGERREGFNGGSASGAQKQQPEAAAAVKSNTPPPLPPFERLQLMSVLFNGFLSPLPSCSHSVVSIPLASLKEEGNPPFPFRYTTTTRGSLPFHYSIGDSTLHLERDAPLNSSAPVSGEDFKFLVSRYNGWPSET